MKIISFSKRVRAGLRGVALLIGGLGAQPFLRAAEPAPARPNVVFILADDLTFRDIGCYGSPNVKTPHIDALATEGVLFTHCFQAAPMCSPTRHNIYTGLYPVKSGAYPQSTWVKPGTKSVAHYLGALGYRVALAGKRHVAPIEAFPFEYLDDGGDPNLAGLEKFMSRDRTQPFCAFVCFHEPHTPWNRGDPAIYDPAKIVLPPYLVDTPETRNQIVKYYAEINYLDNKVGQVERMIDRLHLADNTVLIFASEQGNAMPFAKWTCYDTGLHSALLARWPGRIAAGSVTDAMVEYVDLLPTFIDLAGGQPVGALDGRSFVPVLLGKTDRFKDYTYAEQTTRGITNGSDHYGIRRIRSVKYDYILNLTPEAAFQNNVTAGKGKWTSFWKTWVAKAATDENARVLVNRFQHRPGVELYDVVADPEELHNIADDPAMKPVLADMKQRLQAWMDSQGDRGEATEMEALDHTFKGEALRGKED